MDKIIKKDIVNGVEYKYNGIGGGSSPTGEGHEVITQAAYDQLTPAQKAEKVYMIKGEGVAPTPSSIDADDVNYDNTTSGMTATNVQDALDEVFQSVSNGKELIADAITDKGVSTSATDSFQTMASNISSLDIATQEQIQTYNLARGKNILIDTVSESNVNNPYTRFYTYLIEDKLFVIAGVCNSSSGNNDSTMSGKMYMFNADYTYSVVLNSCEVAQMINRIYTKGGDYYLTQEYYTSSSSHSYLRYRINSDFSVTQITGNQSVDSTYQEYSSSYTFPYNVTGNQTSRPGLNSINIMIPVA